MYHNAEYADITEALPPLMRKIIETGEEVGSRQGARTLELTMVGTTLLHPWRREILVPDRKVNIAAQISETMWVLSGKDNAEWLSHYLPRALDFSDDGKTWRGAYGPRLRAWNPSPEDGHRDTDQLSQLLDLMRADRSTRRAVMSIFDPAIDHQDGKDIPCNNWLSFISRLGKLDLHVAIRSNDLMWGWSGINAFEWSALQEIVAGMLGVGVGGLHFSTTSLHLYDQHWAKAAKLAHTDVPERVLKDSPRFNADVVGRNLDQLDVLMADWFLIENRIRTGVSHGEAKALQAEIDTFPEPMLRSWLRVLQWWWTADRKHLEPLAGTRLEEATRVAMQPPTRLRLQDINLQPAQLVIHTEGGGRVTIEGPATMGNTNPIGIEHQTEFGRVVVELSPFLRHVHQLHLDKEAAYGGSWKRRGEMLGIMANIARKIDRLTGGVTEDETAADTAIDLMVYLAKYRTWLLDQEDNGSRSDQASTANDVLSGVEDDVDWGDELLHTHDLEKSLTMAFERLEEAVVAQHLDERFSLVDGMLEDAYKLARALWQDETWKAGNATRSWNPEAGQDA